MSELFFILFLNSQWDASQIDMMLPFFWCQCDQPSDSSMRSGQNLMTHLPTNHMLHFVDMVSVGLQADPCCHVSLQLWLSLNILWWWCGNFLYGSNLDIVDPTVCLPQASINLILCRKECVFDIRTPFLSLSTNHILLASSTQKYYCHRLSTCLDDLPRVPHIQLVPTCLSFTLFPGCFKYSDFFLTPLLYNAG